mmetsp:Transcript_21560/g.32079  ORF Transcript_21560/g.32079 Transcript_21560/m.32079 type:complete len:309 (+) Transcript_21560:22-948(+)
MRWPILLAFLVVASVLISAEDIPEASKNSSSIDTTKIDGDEPGKPEAAIIKGEKKGKPNPDDGKMEPGEIKELFDRFDEDSNGFLNRKELFRYFVVTTPPDSELGKLYKKKDYFNIVKYREFCNSVGANPLTGLTLEDIKRAYEKNYGYAHKDWIITAGMRSLKIPKKEKDHVKRAFVAFDVDSNGFLNWPEIQNLAPKLKLEQYESLANALNADVSEGIDQHGIIKAYTRRTSPIRVAIKAWEEPPEPVVFIEKTNNTMALYILLVFFVVCLLAPIMAWACGVHKTVQGRRVIKQTARQMQEIVKAT